MHGGCCCSPLLRNCKKHSMRTCKNLGVSLLLSLFFLTASGQSQPHTAQDLEVIRAALPQDQPYMLFSKGIYETGEDMWFKAWLFDRSLLDTVRQEPDSLSENL